MSRAALYSIVASTLLLTSGCDDKPSDKPADKTKSSASATSASAPASAPPEPAQPAKLVLVLDEARFSAGSDRVDLAAADAESQIAHSVAGRQGVDGEIVDVIVARGVLTPKVAMVVSGLRAAKAKGANVKSQRRDKTTANIVFTWGATRPECAAVGMIGKDNAITAWSVGGGTATRFAHGFAGPDITLGSAGVRKVAQACDAAIWYVSAADEITWGLTFDFALAVSIGDDGGAPQRATATTLLVDPPVPGRKVAQD